MSEYRKEIYYASADQRIQNAFCKADMENVSVRMYPGRHDILHDSCGNDVLKDMGDWLESRMSE